MFKHTILVAAVAGLVLALGGTAQASILVDVSPFNDAAGNWNIIKVSGWPFPSGNPLIANLIGSDGILTGAALITSSDGDTGKETSTASAADITSPSGLIHPTNATYDSAFVDGGLITLKITGLSAPGYNVYLLSRTASSKVWDVDFNVNSLGVQWIASANNTTFVTYANVVPIAGAITITAASHNGGPGVLNSFELEAIPEPATLALLGLGGLGLIQGRKRK